MVGLHEWEQVERVWSGRRGAEGLGPLKLRKGVEASERGASCIAPACKRTVGAVIVPRSRSSLLGAVCVTALTYLNGQSFYLICILYYPHYIATFHAMTRPLRLHSIIPLLVE